MKNKFIFCGVQSAERRALSRELLNNSKKMSVTEVIVLIKALYNREEREYQYIASDMAEKNVKRFSLEQVLELSKLVSQKAWWDSVDALRKFFSLWAQNNPQYFDHLFHIFYESEDFWMRRVAINLQLKYKEATQTDYLVKSILKDQYTDEFFVQKAIGWSLREYSKTNPEWVREFIESHDLSKLAVREGSKYL